MITAAASWDNLNSIMEIAIQVLDVALVALIFYWIYRLTKGTSAIPVFMGILAIYIIWQVVSLAEMPFMSDLLGQFIAVGILAVIILFQQEIRQFLFSIGDQASFKAPPTWLTRILPRRTFESKSKLPIEEIVRALDRLASRKEGALIVIERNSDLKLQIQSATPLRADAFAPLIQAIFHKDSSMHDGGIHIVGGQIRAVRCVLPVSQSPHIPAELGTRHRSALGLSEITDAVIWVVSEETGVISLAHDGELRRALTPSECREIMHDLFRIAAPSQEAQADSED